MTEENTTPETAQTQATEGMLSVADLKMMARIIQVGSQRGSFKAEEMVTVGGLYDKIIGFLRAAGQLDPAPEDAPAPDADAVEKEINEPDETVEETTAMDSLPSDVEPTNED
tara:strand:- start:13937 stop:14272 length:336 start_codon:yes stop_codon:yes gene_type:complete